MKEVPIKIDQFILENIEKHSSDIVTVVAEKFGFSRQRAHEYVDREVKKGILIKVGRTSATRYFLVQGNYLEFTVNLKFGLAEDQVWTEYLKPMMQRFPDNIYRICNYGFTEILNNAIDHSNGKSVLISVEIKDERIKINIMDDGIGIFEKIQKALNLHSMREALLHLSKGKFTTDPANHTGEGIFFTSRICDKFAILSNDLYYTFLGHDWFLSSEKRETGSEGTLISMIVSLNSTKTPKEVMDQYADQEIGFTKTIVAVALSADPNDPHNSRSQAKRLMMGLEKFRQIILDFQGVESVGQAFIDEVFRVFKNEYPNIMIQFTNANDEVTSMITRAGTDAVNLDKVE